MFAEQYSAKHANAAFMTDWDDKTSFALEPEVTEQEKDARDRAYLIVIAGSNVGEMHKLDHKLTILGRSVDSNIRLIDDGISRHHCRVRVEAEQVMVEDLASRNGTFCNGERFSHHVLQDGDKLQLGQTTILKFSYHDHLEESFQKQMLESALRDGLTGTYNKRYFLDRLGSEIKFAVRHKDNLAIILMDLDKFKLVNDTYGHLAGDKVLTRFAQMVQHSIRNEDVFARYGGEEFAIITRSISRADVYHFADRLRQEASELTIEFDGARIPITVSMGIATIPEDSAEPPEQLIKSADDMLYEAKRGGRNRIVMTSH
ncbi:MAG: diguanylate cyclase [Myxococcales bacterium]|nr:diguanylate cyclase [Myxococcales bacterium]